MTVELVWATDNAEKLILKMARVSSSNPNSENTKLIQYLLKHGHFSPFQMASMCVEVITSRAISAQICRHRSLNVQEFSQRYAEAQNCIKYPIRRQDVKNRQNSIDDIPENLQTLWAVKQHDLIEKAQTMYKWALNMGIARENARMILPMCSETRMYIAATLRDWIFYLKQRTDSSTQLEHREIANKIKGIFVQQFPIISESLEWRV